MPASPGTSAINRPSVRRFSLQKPVPPFSFLLVLLRSLSAALHNRPAFWPRTANETPWPCFLCYRCVRKRIFRGFSATRTHYSTGKFSRQLPVFNVIQQ